MIKNLLVLAAGIAFAASSAFAANDACCAKANGAKQVSNKTKAECISFANLNLNATQKAKLDSLQAECMKAGCTKQSHEKFLSQAKSVLSKEQYSALKKECGSGHRDKVS